MANDQVDTAQLNRWVDRMRAGDRGAADDLLRGVCDRLERLARKMLARFPDVHRWADTGDVLQNSLIRLLRALESVRPASTRAFFGLAAEQMRRELLDLARHFRGPLGPGRNEPARLDAADPSPAAPDDPRAEMDRWSAFHVEVEKLPTEEREVVGLIYYHGWTRAQVAEQLRVSVRTVQRWWGSAALKLRTVIED